MVRVISSLVVFGGLVLAALVVFQLVVNYRRRFIVRTEEKVEALYLGVPPERLWLFAILGAAGGAILMAAVSNFVPLLVAAGAVIGFTIPQLYLRSLERRRRSEFDGQLLEAITMIAAAMKAGMSLLQAMEQITREMDPPIRQEFAYALRENRVGKPIIRALQDMKQRIRSEDLNMTVDAVAIAQETGGVLSDVLVKITDAIRSRNRVRAKITSLTAQGQLQGIVMSLLPWGLAVIMFVIDRDLVRPMFTTTPGQLTLAVIATLELAGWFIIRRMVTVDV